MNVAAIVAAAGAGKRLKAGKPKPFIRVMGKPLLAHTLSHLERSFRFSEILVAVHPRRIREAEALARRYSLENVRFVAGGKTRAQSVRSAVLASSPESRWVLIHDAARPMVRGALVRGLLRAAGKTGAAICAIPATATVKKVDVRRGIALSTEDRRSLWLAQTPQVFKKALLLDRYEKLGEKASRCTDEAALFDGSSVKVRVVLGDPSNIKVTTPEDLEWFKVYASRHRI